MLLDDVAADFPELTIIMAHPSVPWQDEAISIATHKANVYIDLSGWSPKYFPPQLVQRRRRLLKHKVLFGSDFPLIAPDRWLRDFEALDLKPEVRPLILKDNAARVPTAGRERLQHAVRNSTRLVRVDVGGADLRVEVQVDEHLGDARRVEPVEVARISSGVPVSEPPALIVADLVASRTTPRR